PAWCLYQPSLFPLRFHWRVRRFRRFGRLSPRTATGIDGEPRQVRRRRDGGRRCGGLALGSSLRGFRPLTKIDTCGRDCHENDEKDEVESAFHRRGPPKPLAKATPE